MIASGSHDEAAALFTGDDVAVSAEVTTWGASTMTVTLDVGRGSVVRGVPHRPSDLVSPRRWRGDDEAVGRRHGLRHALLDAEDVVLRERDREQR